MNAPPPHVIEPRHLRAFYGYIQAARRWAREDPSLAAAPDIRALLDAYPPEQEAEISALDRERFPNMTGQVKTPNEQRFGQIADSMPQLVWVTRTDGRHDYFNRRWYEYTGVPEGSTGGESWIGLFHPDDEERVRQDWAHCRETGQIYEIEYRLRGRDGEYRWFLCRAQPVRDLDGHVLNWFGTCTDIESSKRAEQALKQREERVRLAAEAAELGIWVWDLANDRASWENKRLHRLFGMQEDEPPLDSAQFRAEFLHPDDLQAFDLANSEALSGGSRFHFLGRIRRRNGEIRWVEFTGRPVGGSDGSQRVMHGTAADVTSRMQADADRKLAEAELRASEERFREIFEHALTGIAITDLEGRFQRCNPAYCHLLGYTEDELRGRHYASLIHPEDTGANLEEIRRLYSGELTHFEIENRYLRKDGESVWVHKVVSLLCSASGERAHLLALVTDVTERRRSEAAVEQARDAAEAANRGKDRFLAVLSHELRTPLTPVLMTAAALAEDPGLPDEIRAQCGMIERNVALEARLIDDLLDLTRITRGKLELRAERCNAHSLAGMVVEMVLEEARQKHVTLHLNLDARRCQLTGDPARLQQVFWNLLRNAVKFSGPEGHVRMRTWDAGPPPESRFCVEFSDDGIGFEPEAAARIFEPFEQSDSGHRFGGLGLGLAIARAVVEMHSGTIRAHSPGPGQGAVFTVELPGATAPAGASDARAPSSNGHHAPQSPLRLLLVDDHEPTLQVLTRLLARAGHTVTAARSLAEARSAAAQDAFDAVISDLGLPDGTGLELMQTLRADHGLQGIALSGYGTDADLRRSLEAGFVTHLVKPVDMTELSRALRQFAP
jgi:two-component system CheB/CheR fusion protein